MTDPRPDARSEARPDTRPDARLVQLHAERGDPQARLAQALADLEGADWGLLLAGEAALARQMAGLLGAGTLRVDGRIDIDRAAFAEAGLAVADLYGDLSGARAVWLLEPDERTLERAARAGVKIIVDVTLAPGGGWMERGADFLVYRNGFTLSGHNDAPLAALFGAGTPAKALAPAPSDLAIALALRDVATLPLRLARAARTVSNLSSRLGGTAREAGPTALLLAPDAAGDTLTPLGGVLAATRHVPEGVLLTPGLQDTESVLELLRGAEQVSRGQIGEAREADPREDRSPERPDRRIMPRRFERNNGSSANSSSNRDSRSADSRHPEGRSPEGRSFDKNAAGGRSTFRPTLPPRPDRPLPSEKARPEEGRPEEGRSQASRPQQAASLERFVFEAPAEALATAPSLPNTNEIWESEIVFSDLEHAPPPLTHTVSNGPDAPDVLPGLPDVLQPDPVADSSTEAVTEPELVQQATKKEAATKTSPKKTDTTKERQPSEVIPLTPDLPVPQEALAKDDPAANLTDEQAAIYARLREWRNAEAKRQEISRFIIASNATLAEIARRIPYTEADLKAVKGMGPERMKKYGEKMLAVVRG